jgi:ribosomal protein S18 acetylase RimI-like enzyme
MSPFRRARGDDDLRCTDLTLQQVRALPHIASGFTTDVVYNLRRSETESGMSWSMERVEGQRFVKVYDNGDPREWLDPYFGETPAQRLRFRGADREGEVLGLVTYCEMSWNDTVWLMDIRVRDSARRNGVGSALMSDLQATASLLGVRGIWLETQINNVPAIEFYRRNGFRISGFNDRLYENDDLDRQDVALYMFWERS